MLVAVVVLLTLAGCSSQKAMEAVPFVVSSEEADAYHAVMFDGGASDYENREFTKEGVFAAIFDAYNDVTRYYVWGYNDEERTGEWQWELKPDDTSDLPANGSLITVTATLTASEDALDHYWLTQISDISVKTSYSGYKCDYDLTVMSPTLQRVEIQNILYKKEAFEGKTVAIVGRAHVHDETHGDHVHHETNIINPYNEEMWEIAVESEDAFPESETMVIVTGTIADGVITDATVSETDLF